MSQKEFQRDPSLSWCYLARLRGPAVMSGRPTLGLLCGDGPKLSCWINEQPRPLSGYLREKDSHILVDVI